MSAASEYARLKEKEIGGIMGKTILETVEEAVAQFEEIKGNVERERCKLQAVYYEIEELLNNMGDAIEDFEEGKRLMQSGLDELSKVV